ncbi:hypothetical protein GCM10007171_29460 [Dickeya fangzhongdai]|nr:hypothetical protein GCM10007171_29460 [Dickeya fangzhongdai]
MDAIAGAAAASRAALSSKGVIRDIRYSSMIDDRSGVVTITHGAKVQANAHAAECMA